VKAIAFDREVRVVGFPSFSPGEDGDSAWMTASAFAGLALLFFAGVSLHLGRASRAAVDGPLVEREVVAALRAFGATDARAEKAGKVARLAFDAHLEVTREIVDQDLAAIRIGRRDARAGALEG
jgi:hypothetical protein